MKTLNELREEDKEERTVRQQEEDNRIWRYSWEKINHNNILVIIFFYLEIGIIIKIQIQGRGRINKNTIHNSSISSRNYWKRRWDTTEPTGHWDRT